MEPNGKTLFDPVTIDAVTLRNRIVMAPMTRGMAPGGIPGPDLAAYYRRRAEGGVGLIITEGLWIQHPTASNDPNVPCFYGAEALASWGNILEQVHAAGAHMIPQLWHVGIAPKVEIPELYSEGAEQHTLPVGPSGVALSGAISGRAMSQKDIDEVSDAYVSAASAAFDLGFDGVELHAAHGYLIDQFFWGRTNERTDRYGGDIRARSTFAAEIVKQIRARTSADFLISLRFSQWKIQDFDARPWPSPGDLEQFLSPLVDAGVSVFHCSQRRFWIPEFDGSTLNLAGWTQKLTGKPAITVGSIGQDVEFLDALMNGATSAAPGIGDLLRRLRDGEFDLVAIGRPLIANPDWAEKVHAGDISSLRPFSREMLRHLD